jgi:hypothetical protein
VVSDVTFVAAGEPVNEFIALLDEIGHPILQQSNTENDALAASEIIDIWKGRTPYPKDHRPVVRAALGKLLAEGCRYRETDQGLLTADHECK